MTHRKERRRLDRKMLKRNSGEKTIDVGARQKMKTIDVGAR